MGGVLSYELLQVSRTQVGTNVAFAGGRYAFFAFDSLVNTAHVVV